MTFVRNTTAQGPPTSPRRTPETVAEQCAPYLRASPHSGRENAPWSKPCECQ